TFALLQEASGERLSLDNYLRRSAPGSSALDTMFLKFHQRHYTTFDGVSTAVRVLQIAERFPSRVVVRYARDITLRDLSPGNAVIIGRPSTNLWAELFETKLNFRIDSDFAQHRVVCRNLAPKAGEQAEYVPKVDGQTIEGYSSVAFLGNLN